jgi:hypothetical protein
LIILLIGDEKNKILFEYNKSMGGDKQKNGGHFLIGFAKSLDIFGSPVVLKVRNQPSYNSLLGAFFSIGIYAFSYYSFISMVIELYNRESPNIVTRIDYTPHPEVIVNYIFKFVQGVYFKGLRFPIPIPCDH